MLATLNLKHLDDRCMCVRLWLKFSCFCYTHQSALACEQPAMEKNQSNAHEIPLIQDLREAHYVQTSPESLCTLASIDRVVTWEPLSFSGPIITDKSEIIRDGGVLGHQKEDQKDNSAGSSFPPSVPQETVQKDAGAETPGPGRVQEDVLPAEGEERELQEDAEKIKEKKEDDKLLASGQGAMTPAKKKARPYQSLIVLERDLSENKHRLHQGLHPEAPLVAAGISRFGQGGEHEHHERKLLQAAGPSGGTDLWPGYGPGLFQGSAAVAKSKQVMSPTCDEEKRTFGGLDSTPVMMLNEGTAKRYRESTEGEQQKVNLFDLKKEIKEEVIQDIKAEYGKFINLVTEKAKEEILKNQNLLEGMIKTNAEYNDEWRKSLQTHCQGVQTEGEQLRAMVESMKIQLPREIRIDMNDTMDDLKQQVEARIDIIDENQRKALEEMKEEERYKSDR